MKQARIEAEDMYASLANNVSKKLLSTEKPFKVCGVKLLLHFPVGGSRHISPN